MSSWTSEELDKSGRSEESQSAPLRHDRTRGNPVTICVVRTGDELYVRSYKGRGGAWFRAAQARRRGRISADGVDKDVTFVEETDPGTNDQIDAAANTAAIARSMLIRWSLLRRAPRS